MLIINSISILNRGANKERGTRNGHKERAQGTARDCYFMKVK
jgi:hypothetical protein